MSDRVPFRVRIERADGALATIVVYAKDRFDASLKASAALDPGQRVLAIREPKA